MFKPTHSLTTSLILLAAVALAGCGAKAQLTGAGLKAGSALGARSVEWEKPVLLDNFDDYPDDEPYNVNEYTPDRHPFFDPIVFTKVNAAGTTGRALEVLAPNRPKPLKGVYLAEMVENGLCQRGDEGKETVAPHVRVSFRWGNNGAPTTDSAIYLQTVFLIDHAGFKEPVALAYAWTNKYCPGSVIASKFGEGDEMYDMRTIVLSNAPSSPAMPCSEDALDQIKLAKVTRDFGADVRWAFGNRVQLTDAGQASSGECKPPAAPWPNWPTPQEEPGTVNTAVRAIMGVGAGADIPKGICTHAIVDDIYLQLKWSK